MQKHTISDSFLKESLFSDQNSDLLASAFENHFPTPAWTWKNGWILKVVEILLVFSVWTASVERSFSTFNLIVTILRGRLLQGSKEKLTHISFASPGVSEFDPEPILIFWKELSKMKMFIFFGSHIPSINKVCQHEMYERSKNMQKWCIKFYLVSK